MEGVILSAAKNLSWGEQRFFAALRMTAFAWRISNNLPAKTCPLPGSFIACLLLCMNHQQQPALQRNLGLFRNKRVAYPAWLAETQGFVVQGVIQSPGAYAGGVTC